jgi:hypothetical protein
MIKSLHGHDATIQRGRSSRLLKEVLLENDQEKIMKFMDHSRKHKHKIYSRHKKKLKGSKGEDLFQKNF